MANRLSLRLHQRLPNSVPISSTSPVTCAIGDSVSHTSVKIAKFNTGRAHRRLLLGIGASSILAQFMSMDSRIGAKSFIASAAQKGTSSVEQVVFHMILEVLSPVSDLFLEFSFVGFLSFPGLVTNWSIMGIL